MNLQLPLPQRSPAVWGWRPGVRLGTGPLVAVGPELPERGGGGAVFHNPMETFRFFVSVILLMGLFREVVTGLFLRF